MAYNDVKNFSSVISWKDRLEYLSNYNFEFENDIDYFGNLQTFDRYFIYRATNSNSKDTVYAHGWEFAKWALQNYPGLKDCDGCGTDNKVCLLSRDIYKILWGWDLKEFKEDERHKSNSINSNETRDFDVNEMGPDTMNSVQNMLDILVENKITNEYSYLDVRQLKTWNFSINFMLELYANETTNKPFLNMLDSIPFLKEYIDAYHTLGNFCLVPKAFNNFRNMKVKDNWAASLKMLKNKTKNDKWIAQEHEIIWDSNNFVKYINFFFLWDYVNDGEPIQLNYDNQEFMQKTVKFIKRRGIFMVAMLRIANEYQDIYKEIQQMFLDNTAIFNNYGDVFYEKIEITKNNDKVKELLSEAQSLINKITI